MNLVLKFLTRFLIHKDVVLLIAGINRLPHAIKDLSLTLSISTPNGEFILGEEDVALANADVIDSNSMISVVIQPIPKQLIIADE